MFNSNEEALEACLANGAIQTADTLEELADIIGFSGADRENFFATIERYNELADKGVDDDFGKNPEYLKKTAVRTSPFYSIKRSPGPLALLDGIYTTPHMEALDNDMNLIPGLYATGNVVHSMFGCDYTLNPGGISCGHAIPSGYVAGKAAVGALPDYRATYKPPTGEGTLVSPG
jgi:fumarate reductase flavoprotein subunit